jgi:fatty acid desaturase/predicted heme/steroid binding protein
MGKGGEAPREKSQPHEVERLFTWKDVQRHNTPDDAWIVYQDKVYDVSNWTDHPGGAVIFTHAGDDMTDIFAAFHAPHSHVAMRRFQIGMLDTKEPTYPKSQSQRDFENGYRELRQQLVQMGLFQSNPWYYAYKCTSNLAIWAGAMTLVYAYPERTAVHFVAAGIMGLFFQQCGWLAHDFLHHQVFPKHRQYGDYMGLFWGGVMQGFSTQWWKNKHNGHHAVPNLHNSSLESQDGDPDIDTMPLLAWSIQQAQSYRQINQGRDSSFVKFTIRYQAYLYFPILLLARLSWMNESFKTAFGLGASSANAELELKRKGLQYPILEKVAILIHYAWAVAFASGFGQFSILYSFGIFLFMTASCGLMLALVFGLGHNGMAVYDADKRPDFWKLQVTTTRNITGGHGFPQAFVDWFCGGLQYQVDHHLFPTLPRHSLPKAHALVKSFCKQWNVQYHETDLVDGTIEVLKHLASVSDQFVMDYIKEGPAM